MTREELGLIRAALKWHAVRVICGTPTESSNKMLSRAAKKLLKAQPKSTWEYPNKGKKKK